MVFDPALYAMLPAKKEEEEDMLDLAWGLTDTCVTNNRCIWMDVGEEAGGPSSTRVWCLCAVCL